MLDAAIAEWNAGRYYEAHEILEDVAEQFEEDDPAFEWALALTRVAACLHKLRAGVGVRAVPAKLATALDTLRGAPNDWLGIDLLRLRSDLDALASRIAASVPADLELPRIFVR